jgi:hypothetical protein
MRCRAVFVKPPLLTSRFLLGQARYSRNLQFDILPNC